MKYLRKEVCMQQNLFEHFSGDCHWGFLHDTSIVYVGKTDHKHPNKWKHYWQHTPKTMVPQGLNVEDN